MIYNKLLKLKNLKIFIIDNTSFIIVNSFSITVISLLITFGAHLEIKLKNE